ncbi:unnamed protein product [Penicillium olsonii]|uniref:Zn(2)-C6 fungal-type domain-containing protein n=1 Tax=Penicillium olsonii TaxID=99116 RepID=A0A9W4HAK7_PENOL|nr:unnamed protein product [Penicillium olsonii]CAG8062535.1 unnamed protein product [Penicillium olsonii]
MDPILSSILSILSANEGPAIQNYPSPLWSRFLNSHPCNDMPKMNAQKQKGYSRSRNGCLQCRGRHQKCDERKPKCSLCASRQVHCEYSSTRKFVQSTGPLMMRHKPRETRSYPDPKDNSMPEACLFLETGSFDNEIDNAAWNYYVHIVSPHIPAIDGPENPYRELSVIALSSPVLLHTIICIASEHMLNSGLVSVSTAAVHKLRMLKSIDRCLKQIHAQDRAQNQTPYSDMDTEFNTVLAAIVLQGVVVALTHNEAPKPHIVYALSLLRPTQLLHTIPRTPLIRMVLQRFAIMDVTVSISRQRRPCAPRDFILYQPAPFWDASEPSVLKMTGCPQPLMCFLVQISHLSNDIDEGLEQGLASGLSRASALQSELQSWWLGYGESNPTSPRDPLSLLTECYFHAAELLLARRVFKYPTTSPMTQKIVQTSLGLMKDLSPGCGVDSSLPQPFYLTAREALSPTDRDWVRRRHVEMGYSYREQQRNATMDHIENIWRTVDRFLAEPNQAKKFGTLDARIKGLDRSSAVFIF